MYLVEINVYDIILAIDSGKVAALVLLDLSAAFDTVDHTTLLEVLRRRMIRRSHGSSHT
jgi:hypothetical protein